MTQLVVTAATSLSDLSSEAGSLTVINATTRIEKRKEPRRQPAKVMPGGEFDTVKLRWPTSLD